MESIKKEYQQVLYFFQLSPKFMERIQIERSSEKFPGNSNPGDFPLDFMFKPQHYPLNINSDEEITINPPITRKFY